MPITAQLLYFHLSMRADDDGFVNKPKSIMRMCSCKEDDLKVLISKQFIIPFASGVVVIKHWKIHNYIRKDTYTETKYKAEKAMLMPDENNAYIQNIEGLSQVRDECVTGTWTQDRLGKDRIGKDNIYSNSDKQNCKPTRHKYGEYKNVLLSDEELKTLQEEFPTDYEERIERLSSYIASTGKKYKNFLATIRNWAKKDKEQVKSESTKNYTPPDDGLLEFIEKGVTKNV